MMGSLRPVVLLVSAMLFNLAKADDDDFCFLNNRLVLERDCPHDCCSGNYCGSESDCRAQWIIAVIIVCCVVGACVIVGTVLFMWCTKSGPFKRRVVVVETTHPYSNPQPVYVHPQPEHPQQSAYPQPQPAYPQPQPAYPQPQPAYPQPQPAYPQPQPAYPQPQPV
ncbi:hypothetical protein DIPPA_52454, partial [Diplonema papillatum]